jgi:hypothetical protein
MPLAKMERDGSSDASDPFPERRRLLSRGWLLYSSHECFGLGRTPCDEAIEHRDEECRDEGRGEHAADHAHRSIPGGLKNAIDWASRPYGKNSFTRKPSAVIGTSPGSIGTAVAQQSLRSVLSFCNSSQMNAPEAYIQFSQGLISDAGEVSVQTTEQFLRGYMEEFAAFVARVLSVLPRDG